jgi:hypothetical protein
MARESRTIQAACGIQGCRPAVPARPAVPGRPAVRQRRMPPKRRRGVRAHRASQDFQMNLECRCAAGGRPVVRERSRGVQDHGVIRGNPELRTVRVALGRHSLRTARVARGRRGRRTASHPGRALVPEQNRKPSRAQDRPDIPVAVLGPDRPVLGRQELRRLAPRYRRAGLGPEEPGVVRLGSGGLEAEQPGFGCAYPAFCLASRMSWEHGRGDPRPPGSGGRSAAAAGARVRSRRQPFHRSGRHRTRRRAGRCSLPERRAGRCSPDSRWLEGRSGPRRPGLGGGCQGSGSG